MAEGVVQLPPDGTGKKLRTQEVTVGGVLVEEEVVTLADAAGNLWDRVPVTLGSFSDLNNSKVITSGDASPGNPWIGTWRSTADVVNIESICDSAVASGLGGTFTFEFSDTGTEVALGLAKVSESRVIGDFETLRDTPLQVVPSYYRAAFEPSRILTAGEAVFVATTMHRVYPGPFARLAGQQIEEANAAMGQAFAFLKAFDERTGKSRNIRPSPTGALWVADEKTFVTESGSLDTESVRDDISLSFSRDNGTAALSHLVNLSTAGATVTADATEGQAVFATSAVAGRTAFYRSDTKAIYEPGHMIRGEQTIQIAPALAGTAKVEWGFGEDDGAGDVLNGIGWGLDVQGLYAWRKKAGAYASKVYRTAFNYDTLGGAASSRFRKIGGPVAYDSTKNTLYNVAFEWLGIAPPIYRIQNPTGAFVTAHIEETSNQLAGTTVPEPSLGMFVRVSNGNQATNYQVRSGSWRGGIYTSKVLSDPARAFRTGQQDIGIVASALGLSSLARRAVRLKNMTSSARAGFYGNAGVSTATGDEIAPGEAIDLDLDEGQLIYAITTSTGGAGVRFSWVELGG